MLYRHTKKGIVTTMYADQRKRSKHNEYNLPSYTKEEFKEWLFGQPNFDQLYENWVKNEFKKDFKPSVDRLDDYLPYSFKNIRLVTFRENYKKSHLDVKLGINNKKNKEVHQYTKEGTYINSFHSSQEAERSTKIPHQNIVSNCLGKRNTAGGFKWTNKKLTENGISI